MRLGAGHFLSQGRDLSCRISHCPNATLSTTYTEYARKSQASQTRHYSSFSTHRSAISCKSMLPQNCKYPVPCLALSPLNHSRQSFNRPSRNCRFHKAMQMWLTKDPNLPDPIRTDAKGEQGSYIFFDFRRWEKVRVSTPKGTTHLKTRLKK